MVYEGTCRDCWYFDNSTPQKEGKSYGICKDRYNFKRNGSIVDGKERRTCYKTQVDVVFRDKDTSKQAKLF